MSKPVGKPAHQSPLSEYTTQPAVQSTQQHFFDSKVIPTNQIATLWDSPDPNAHAQSLFLAYLQNESLSQKTDLNKWDDCESRFEANELRWIADFIVNNLVFCRTQLKLTDDDKTTSQVLQLLWEVLNLFGEQ